MKSVPLAVLAAVFIIVAMPRQVEARYAHAPRHPRENITFAFIYVQAAAHLRDEMLQPSRGERSLAQRSLRSLWNSWPPTTFLGPRREALPRRLIYRALRRVPVARPYGFARRLPRFRRPFGTSTASAMQVQMVAMSRFSDTDCWLYPYVFTMQYDSVTGALIQETAALATPAISATSDMPEQMQVC